MQRDREGPPQSGAQELGGAGAEEGAGQSGRGGEAKRALFRLGKAGKG